MRSGRTDRRARGGAVRAGVACALAFAMACVARSAAADDRRPNVILIFVDDMGYGDPGCYGGDLVPTPAIDSLARDGVRFTDGYVTAPVCGPSRFGLLTGAYQQRFGCQWNEDLWAKSRGALPLPPSHLSLPEAMRSAGYVAGHLGKWNFVRDVFAACDEARDVMDWEGDYFPGTDGHYTGVDDPDEHASGKVQGMWGGDGGDAEYLTDRIGRHAVEFIDRHKARPFFLYLAFNAVHSPWQAKASERARFAAIREQPLDLYAAMIASLDENVGRVLAKLRAEGLERDTLVAFASDNGPARGGPHIKGWRDGWVKEILVGSADGLAGWKGRFLEGGIRVPFLLRWPARLKGGAIYRHPVSTLDLYPTFLAAAGAPVPGGARLDGVNLLPHLSGERDGAPHEILFWKNGDEGAVRQGSWKLVISPWKPKRQLFDLGTDLGETRDRSADQTELAGRLHRAWLDWSAGFPPRANPPAVGKGKGKGKG